MNLVLETPGELMVRIASGARSRRLALNLSQKTLSAKSGVSLGVLKKFERTGQISLESLLKLALALGSMGDFGNLFSSPPPESILTLDELIQDEGRKRGRK